MTDERALRADARRNRARVLEVAAEVFATEGLSVPVHEIARRAGVGTGTVSRHFPTKEDLLIAIMSTRLVKLTAQADELARREDPGTAFFALFVALVRAGAADCGLAELAVADRRLDDIGERAGADLCGRLQELLAAAQKSGDVRADVSYPDIRALMSACMARREDSLEPILAVVTDGLRRGPT
ncbi:MULTISPECIES: TetR/AcrR family transcriptional regulator [unclassified Microbispora]|uniref:TetR/AcrR family transcriptional regulator n=1 Tax=unclassified Microbispora TaxID=2614687 RepID=UPI0014729005|nr:MULTISPECIES: TetR/AcrR family transcriptional regulator [unclassified Microbispora]